MGYSDIKQKIIFTLTGRIVGTRIHPADHQEFALALLDYIRQVELITASTLVGTAERGTVPVQSDKANLAYVAACPVGVKIPDFIAHVAAGDFAAAALKIAEDSSLPAICGRVCPQETQCEGSCILGVKGEPVAISQHKDTGIWRVSFGFSTVFFATYDEALAYCKGRFFDLDGKAV